MRNGDAAHVDRGGIAGLAFLGLLGGRSNRSVSSAHSLHGLCLSSDATGRAFVLFPAIARTAAAHCRHLPVVLRHNPWFALRHAPRMLAHTFRGCGFKTLLGLEDEQAAFRRYQDIRRRERIYL